MVKTKTNIFNSAEKMLIVVDVKSGTLFDNILICDDPEYAKKFAEETWGKQKDVEKAAFEEVEKNKEAKEESEKSDIDQSDVSSCLLSPFGNSLFM
ncbi:hypothetical protein MRB53_030822 [Persea americana]|uniref:Uncharacterized protein n=1 Tax=Persea americana TaxID=3435 RepID=A0ACC2KML8_PERAE|nr:hypothetical protein MRB53_030822 [Persea americana]